MKYRVNYYQDDLSSLLAKKRVSHYCNTLFLDCIPMLNRFAKIEAVFVAVLLNLSKNCFAFSPRFSILFF